MRGPSILVPFDGSRAARVAFAHAVQLAALRGGRVTLLGVVSEQPLGVAAALFTPPVLCADEAEAELARLMQSAREELGGRVPVCAVIRRGRWRDEVLARVIAAEHDLVVVAGMGRKQRRLAARCPVPVIVLRDNRRARVRRRLRVAGGRARTA